MRFWRPHFCSMQTLITPMHFCNNVASFYKMTFDLSPRLPSWISKTTRIEERHIESISWAFDYQKMTILPYNMRSRINLFAHNELSFINKIIMPMHTGLYRPIKWPFFFLGQKPFTGSWRHHWLCFLKHFKYPKIRSSCVTTFFGWWDPPCVV